MAELSAADTALGRLDGVVAVVPDPDLFVAMYVRREAVLSSQIEGTQSSLQDLLDLEIGESRGVKADVSEIVNYVAAMNHGLERLADLPLSGRLIREVHERLLDGVRGSGATPGEFRRSQNWIGPEGTTLEDAVFVPPPVAEMRTAVSDLEKFMHERDLRPNLIDVGLVHAQFETIHPFLDGNGRVGRLLITLMLVERGILSRPLLYLSHFFKRHRAEYYDRLMAVRLSGDWEGWMRFFLRGVAETAGEATENARRIFELREQHRALLLDEGLSQHGLPILSALYDLPMININRASELLDVSFPTANRVIGEMEKLGLLVEISGRRRSRVFRYEPYVSLFGAD
ncbi:MAG: Fic family protein [Solirubrobacterales bacterium]